MLHAQFIRIIVPSTLTQNPLCPIQCQLRGTDVSYAKKLTLWLWKRLVGTGDSVMTDLFGKRKCLNSSHKDGRLFSWGKLSNNK